MKSMFTRWSKLGTQWIVPQFRKGNIRFNLIEQNKYFPTPNLLYRTVSSSQQSEQSKSAVLGGSFTLAFSVLTVSTLNLDSGKQEETKTSLENNNVNINKEIGQAIIRGDLERVKKMLKEQPYAEIKIGQYQTTPLVYAAFHNQLTIVKYLIENKIANIEEKNGNGKTALTMASFSGCENIVKYLLQKNAKIEYGNESVLRVAIDKSHEKIIILILDHCKKNSIRINSVPNPIVRAAVAGKLNIVKMLLNRGEKLTDKDNNGKTAILAATQILYKDREDDYIELIKFIIEKNPESISERDDNGCTPLLHAADANSVKAVQLLIEQGADVNATDFNKRTALHYAVVHRNIEMVKLLLEHGAKPDWTDKDGITPITILEKGIYDYSKEADTFTETGEIENEIKNRLEIEIFSIKNLEEKMKVNNIYLDVKNENSTEFLVYQIKNKAGKIISQQITEHDLSQDALNKIITAIKNGKLDEIHEEEKAKLLLIISLRGHIPKIEDSYKSLVIYLKIYNLLRNTNKKELDFLREQKKQYIEQKEDDLDSAAENFGTDQKCSILGNN